MRRRFTGRLRPTTFPAVVLGVSACLAAGVAIASGGASYPSDSKSVSNAEPGRTKDAVKCPAGRHVTGGGVEVTGDDSTLDLEVGSTLPTKHNTGWSGGANNSGPSNGDMTVTAICEKGAFVYKTVKATVPVDKAVRKVAKCPLGTHVIGGGVGAPGDHGVEVFLSEPRDGPDKGTKFDDAWGGGVDSSQNTKTKMTVTAICAHLGKHAVKKVVGPKQVIPNNTEDSGKAMCPTGTHVVGGGSHTAPHSTDSEVESSFPIDGPDSDSTPDDGWKSFANNDGSGATLKLHAVALCKA